MPLDQAVLEIADELDNAANDLDGKYIKALARQLRLAVKAAERDPIQPGLDDLLRQLKTPTNTQLLMDCPGAQHFVEIDRERKRIRDSKRRRVDVTDPNYREPKPQRTLTCIGGPLDGESADVDDDSVIGQKFEFKGEVYIISVEWNLVYNAIESKRLQARMNKEPIYP